MTIHDGHRSRMRQRFRQEGLDGFAPHEVLELLLYYGRARGDVNPLAHALLDTFGSLKGVFEARPEQLQTVPGVGEEIATLISLMLPMFRRYSACAMEERKRINNRRDAQAYCCALLSGWRTERFYVLSMNADNQVLGQRLIAEGTLTEVSAYPRLVVETALNYNAHSVIFCHNHPGGSPIPSPDDVSTTLHLQGLLEGLNITLLDHIIVAGEEAYSMNQHGNLNAGSLYASLPEDGHMVAADGAGRLLPPSRKKKTVTKGKEKA